MPKSKNKEIPLSELPNNSNDTTESRVTGISKETISLTKKLKVTLKLALCEESFLCKGCETPKHHIELEKALALVDLVITNEE